MPSLKNALWLLLGLLPLSLRHVFYVKLICNFHESFGRRTLSPLLLLEQVFSAGLSFLRWIVLLQIRRYLFLATCLEDLLLNQLQILEF